MNSWIKQTVVYHIYPRSFKDSNSDGIGDLLGIIQKLDYLKELGIGAIWLSPIYKSPMADFGYDISDYCAIDPIFGTFRDCKNLIKEAHKRQIKIIMDYVPNHTSEKHPWFLESKSSKKSSKRDFYIWKNPKPDGTPPNNWLSVFGGSAWEFDKKTGQYYLHSFLREQPDLNWRNPKVIKEMFKVLNFWIKLGVDGFRFDAFEFLIKDQRFLDEPINPNFIKTQRPRESLLHTYTERQPLMYKILGEISRFISKYPNKFIVTESYGGIESMVGFVEEKMSHNVLSIKKMYESCLKNNHAPFNFQLIFVPWEAQKFKQTIKNFESELPLSHIPVYVLGNHDNPRVATRLKSQQRARVAAMLLLTLRGMPVVYYGEEIGMEDVAISKNKMQDPLFKTMPELANNRDPERTPMQWDNSKFAGFSKTVPWLPVAKNYRNVNVASEIKNDKSILNLYKQLIGLRKKFYCLTVGKFEAIELENKNVFGFKRQWKNQNFLILLNFSVKTQHAGLSKFKKGKVLLNTNLDKKMGTLIDLNKLVLKGNEGYVFFV